MYWVIHRNDSSGNYVLLGEGKTLNDALPFRKLSGDLIVHSHDVTKLVVDHSIPRIEHFFVVVQRPWFDSSNPSEGYATKMQEMCFIRRGFQIGESLRAVTRPQWSEPATQEQA